MEIKGTGDLVYINQYSFKKIKAYQGQSRLKFINVK